MPERIDNRLTAEAAADACVFVDTNTTVLTDIITGDFGSKDVVTTGDLEGAGVLFNGDTAAANRLDDYEEGSWTPVLQGSTTGTATYTHQFGDYTKIGRMVTANCRIVTSALGTIAGDLTVEGLPFVSFTGTSSQPSQPCFVGFADNLNITAGQNVTGFVNSNSSVISLRLWDVTTGVSKLQGSEITSTFDIMLSITYQT